MKKLLLIASLVGFVCSASYGQARNESEASSGSVYSRFGVGDPVDISNTAANSMGVFGVSFNDPLVGSLANPANWGSTRYGLGSGGLNLQTFKASGQGDKAQNSTLSVNQFQLLVPLVRGKLGLSGSFSPITHSRYRDISTTTNPISQGATRDTLQYGIEHKGSGGVNRAELGVGWKINRNLSVGYAGSLVFMSIDRRVIGNFANPTYGNVDYKYETSGTALGNRFGISLHLPSIFGDGDQFNIGASLNLPVSFDASRKKVTSFGSQSSSTITSGNNLGDGTVQLPMAFTGGISYMPTPLVILTTETEYQPWSNYENDFKSGTTANAELVDRYKWGAGMQFFPYLKGSDKFFSSFKYRLGASYDSGHVRVNGDRINTLMFSAGLGILAPNKPSSGRSSSSVDISLEYGIRGTNSSNLVKEQIWGLKLSLNLAEIMFFRPKLK